MTDFTALYQNAKGKLVTHGSYSARESFRYCPRKFFLERTEGWKQIEERASALFGKCTEAALQWFEENSRTPGTGVERFTLLWQRVTEAENFSRLTFTDCEGDWGGLMRAGKEMQRLYEIRAPRLPISVNPKPRFQVPLRKKIFPGTELDILENTAYLDILSFPQWDHPLLPRADNPEGLAVRPLIIDCKTSGVNLDWELISLDPQLAEYAWQARVSDVAFLWFVKNSHTLERRNRVTLLESVDGISAGTELFVLGYDRPEKPKKEKKKKSDAPTTDVVEALAEVVEEMALDALAVPVSNEIIRVYLGDRKAQDAYYVHVKGLSPNSALYKAAAKTFFQARFVVSCAPNQITKQRLQFVAARLDETFINETGRGVGQDTVEMIRAYKEGFYPRTGGIRFPNQKCNFCAMRGICGNNPDLRDKLLTRTGEEWFSGAESDSD